MAQWAGVVVGGSPLRVTGLNLQLRDQREVAFPPGFHSTNDDVRLSGELPPQLSKLTKLRTLILHSHHLRGGVPPELGMLENLQVLRLELNNGLEGEVPPELARLPRLKALDLFDTNTGCIPAGPGPAIGLCQSRVGLPRGE